MAAGRIQKNRHDCALWADHAYFCYIEKIQGGYRKWQPPFYIEKIFVKGEKIMEISLKESDFLESFDLLWSIAK